MFKTICNDVLLCIGNNFCDFYIKINLLLSSKVFKELIIEEIPNELCDKLTDKILCNFQNLTHLTITNNGNISDKGIRILPKLRFVKLIVNCINLNTKPYQRLYLHDNKYMNLQYFLFRYNVNLSLKNFESIKDIVLYFLMSRDDTYRRLHDIISFGESCWIDTNNYKTVERVVQCKCVNDLCKCC